MLSRGRAAVSRATDGADMKRVIAIAGFGLTLAGCASWGGSWTSWTPNWDFLPQAQPAAVNVQFQSEPPGAEARTSTGGSCQAPCSLPMDPTKEFSVTFTLAGYLPQTVPVAISKPEGRVEGVSAAEAETDKAFVPNPVAVELEPAPKTPPKKPAPKPAAKPAAKPVAAAPKPAAPKPAAAAPAPARPATAAPAPAARPASPPMAPGSPSPWPPIQ